MPMELEQIQYTEAEQKNPRRNTTTKSDNLYYGGYALLMASFIVYIITEWSGIRNEDDQLTIFVAHYAFAWLFTGILIYNRKFGIVKSWRKENIHLTIILLNLYLISAYALNRLMDVFQDSSDWLSVALIVTSATALSFRFYESLPGFAKGIGKAILGVAIVLYTYMIFYVAPIYAFGTVGTILLGVGFHVFVPLIMVIGLITLITHIYRSHDYSFYWTMIGAGISITYTTFFTIEWKSRIDRIERLSHNDVLETNSELPLWVRIAEGLEDDWITRRILKADLSYATYNRHEWHFLPTQLAWDEVLKHDPLVFIGSMFGKLNLVQEDRIKILHAISERRHKSEERLWRGDNLVTSHIINDIDIYPDLRIAYTENYFDIKNTSEHGRWWGNTQEALYTFQLPEGAVVTSLSLWIEGKEQKGILTSKGKATQAYNTIVGREARDPSVVHWREGNTVVVRVFPCPTNEERKVKIGITTPLEVNDGKLVYRNLVFDGPTAQDAQQTLRLRFPDSKSRIDLPSQFKVDRKGYFIAEQNYDESFALEFPLSSIRENHFTFNGFTYQIASHENKPEAINFQHLYLDLNNAWTNDDLKSIRKIIDYGTALAYSDGELIPIHQGNWDQIVPVLANRNFSLFPFHKIKDADSALVITKGNPLSIQLNDLKETTFANAMQSFFKDGKQIYTFNLVGGTSTYVSSLRELRVLKYATGTPETLKEILVKKQYPSNDESDTRITLHNAAMDITRTPASSEANTNNAPDHLARLFAYNNIMRQTGYHYFDKDYENQNLVAEAAKAYVVSPLSSLIVLESQADYDRFDIKNVDNSLGNAVKQSTGAVPEPHEWVMIMLCVVMVLYLKFKL